MESTKYIIRFSLLMSTVAGYCDTSTFVSGNSTFSAHITGNFVIFAVQAVLGYDHFAWIKLLSFPVFIVAVLSGGWIATKFSKPYFLLLIEGAALIAAGVFAYLAGYHKMIGYTITLVAVFAMGLQNAFGRLFINELYGPTTVMTGNVTQASLNLVKFIQGNGHSSAILRSLGKELVLIGGFLTGCFIGGCISLQIGLVCLCIPGIAIVASAIISKHTQKKLKSTSYLL